MHDSVVELGMRPAGLLQVPIQRVLELHSRHVGRPALLVAELLGTMLPHSQEVGDPAVQLQRQSPT